MIQRLLDWVGSIKAVDGHTPSTVGILATLAGLYALLGGAVSFAGWLFDVPRLTDWDGDGISIQPNATLCVTLSGLALLLLIVKRYRDTVVCGAIVFAIGGLTLLQWFSGLNFGIDSLLMFSRDWGRVGVVFPGRMGPPGSLSWTLIGAALVLSAASPSFRRWAPALALATAVISALSLIGYLYGVQLLFASPYLTVIALQTSTFIMALSLGIIASHPESEPMRTLLDSGSAGTLARRALPLMLLAPVLLGWVRLKGQDAGLYDSNLGTALFALLLMGLLGGLMWTALRALRMREQALHVAHGRADADARNLNEREQRIAGLLGSITDAFVSIDSNWRYTYANEKFLERIGSKQDIIGRSVWELFPDAQSTDFYRQLQHAMKERVSVQYELFHEPWQRWFFERAYPTADGGIAIYSVDTSERKRSEAVVRRSAETFAALVEQSPLGIYTVDSQFRIRNVSEGAMPAFINVKPLIGRDFAEAMSIIWPEPFASEAIAIFRSVLEIGEPYVSPGLTEKRNDSGSTESYEWQVNRVILDDGEAGVVCYFFDTTRLQQAQQALREADRRKNEFLATLAHELRNPLAPVRNAVQLFRMKEPAVPELQWARDVIDRQVQQMTRLIEDLMDVSRISCGKIELKTEWIDLAAVIRGAVETSRPLIEQYGHHLTLDLPERPVYVDADAIRLAQVFGNLLNNAAKFTEGTGAISLVAKQQGGDVIVQIKDSGIGIPGDKLESVFELFSQVHGAPERSRGGLGIGLSLAKRLVEMHGGFIEAHSDGPGMGTKFEVRLPMVVAQQTAAMPPGSNEYDIPATSLRVLIVDDNRDAADSLGMILDSTGNEIRMAYDGEDAVRAAEEFRPQVVFLDIGLPKLDGYEACRQIRQQPWGKEMLIIAVTGWGEDEVQRKAEAVGFNHHMVKPVDPRSVMNILASIPMDRKPGPIQQQTA